jgi:hypothetical protein
MRGPLRALPSRVREARSLHVERYLPARESRAGLARATPFGALAAPWLRSVDQLDYMIRRGVVPVRFEAGRSVASAPLLRRSFLLKHPRGISRSRPHKEASMRSNGPLSEIQAAIGRCLRAEYALTSGTTDLIELQGSTPNLTKESKEGTHRGGPRGRTSRPCSGCTVGRSRRLRLRPLATRSGRLSLAPQARLRNERSVNGE